MVGQRKWAVSQEALGPVAKGEVGWWRRRWPREMGRRRRRRKRSEERAVTGGSWTDLPDCGHRSDTNKKPVYKEKQEKRKRERGREGERERERDEWNEYAALPNSWATIRRLLTARLLSMAAATGAAATTATAAKSTTAAYFYSVAITVASVSSGFFHFIFVFTDWPDRRGWDGGHGAAISGLLAVEPCLFVPVVFTSTGNEVLGPKREKQKRQHLLASACWPLFLFFSDVCWLPLSLLILMLLPSPLLLRPPATAPVPCAAAAIGPAVFFWSVGRRVCLRLWRGGRGPSLHLARQWKPFPFSGVERTLPAVDRPASGRRIESTTGIIGRRWHYGSVPKTWSRPQVSPDCRVGVAASWRRFVFRCGLDLRPLGPSLSPVAGLFWAGY